MTQQNYAASPVQPVEAQQSHCAKTPKSGGELRNLGMRSSSTSGSPSARSLRCRISWSNNPSGREVIRQAPNRSLHFDSDGTGRFRKLLTIRTPIVISAQESKDRRRRRCLVVALLLLRFLSPLALGPGWCASQGSPAVRAAAGGARPEAPVQASGPLAR